MAFFGLFGSDDQKTSAAPNSMLVAEGRALTGVAAKIDASLGGTTEAAQLNAGRLKTASDTLGTPRAATKLAAAQKSVGQAALGEARFAPLSKIMRGGWYVAAALAFKDVALGYRDNGWRGAASAAIDAAVVVLPAGLAATPGAAFGAFVGSAVGPAGTIAGGLAGGMTAGYLVGDFAQTNFLPWAHKLEKLLGLPTPSARAEAALDSQTSVVVDWAAKIAPYTEASGPSLTSALPASLASFIPVSLGGTPQAAPGDPDRPVVAPPRAAPPAPVPAPPQQGRPQAAAPASQTLAAAQKGIAQFAFNSDALSEAEQAALVTADRAVMHQIAEARKARTHARITFPDGHVVDYDGTKNGPITIEVEGHVDTVGGSSSRNQELASRRAGQGAAALKLAARQEGLGDNEVKVEAKGAGVGNGTTAQEQRSATFKFVNTGITA